MIRRFGVALCAVEPFAAYFAVRIGFVSYARSGNGV